MTLESLPNEILIEIFEYLNAFEIFYSFDQLNIRLYSLIRNIPLHLNFEYCRKTIFDQFCTLLKLNPIIKERIYSLILSNKDTCGQIDLFLSFFSLEEFSHLRSLTLIQIEKTNVHKLKLMLPFILTLHSFHLIDVFDLKTEENEILSALPLSNLQTLAIPSLQALLTHTNQPLIITHLTIFSCTPEQLSYQLFKYMPLVKYFHTHNIYKSSHPITTNECSIHYYGTNLKQIIIDNCECTYEEFEIFIKLIPNLKSLTLSAIDNICMIDAHRWEKLIQSSLHSLNSFQFTFGLFCRGKVRHDIIDKFKEFQNDFWCKQHKWYIEYILDSNSAVIYTIPYISNTYRLTRCTAKDSIKLINNSSVFDNVTNLTMCCEAIADNCYYYFSNIRSLKLESTFINLMHDDDNILKAKHIESLMKIVNLYNLTYLDISSCSIIETYSLLQIFRKASNLSSMTIDPYILSIMFNDNELCNYLKKMIKKLNIHKYGHNSFGNLNEVEQFCKIFSNLEQLTCGMNQSDQLLILLNQSLKLSSIKIFVTSTDNSEDLFTWFTNEAVKINLIYRINYIQVYTDGPAELYRLNIRLSKLIQNIPYQLNFQNTHKKIFDQLCTTLCSNPEIKHQIYSLYLSNKDTCGQIDRFLTYFSLNDFTNLQSLTLTEINQQNIIKLKLMLPSLSHLSSFHITSHLIDDFEIINTISMANLRTLSIISFHSIQTRLSETFNIINLTIFSCSLENLFYDLFKYFPLLKYLNLRFLSPYNYPLKKTDEILEKYSGIHLKQLSIGLFKYNFDDLKIFIQQIPNLENFIIYTKDNISMLNASKWEKLIHTSLIYLKNFQFKFGCSRQYADKLILNKIHGFQNDFWCKQHHWYTEYSVEKYYMFIYTIPYLSDTLKLTLDTKRCSKEKHSNVFNKVKNVSLYDDVINNECLYYFSNIQTLELLMTKGNKNFIDMHYLNRIVNLSNLKHLNISEYGNMLPSSLLVEILKQSSKLTWLTINPKDLMLLLNNDELCIYLNRMIRKLDILKYDYPLFNNRNEMNRFCEVFVNIEQLVCYMMESMDVVFLLNQLKQLSMVNIYLSSVNDREYFKNLIEEESHKLNSIYCIEGIDTKAPKLFMWIGRN
ncbi:unnamed protein product [Adineta steineri]|uniref:F-box domain-containing protein n=1 Tax=Adineta steineri TaxID=433720 RepID=A0A814RY28_9BILA|nr:unnamed protein product [Adineta steineri]CAF1286447.1 unnamed protein product [Adineta steineri]